MLTVRSALDGNTVALWERHPDHPGGEVFVAGEREVEAARTAAVERALKDGRLTMAEQVFNYQGKRYTAETLADAPREFLLLLSERGQLPEGVAVPAPEPSAMTVDEVLDAVERGEMDPAAALEAERAGKNRVTLVSALEARAEG